MSLPSGIAPPGRHEAPPESEGAAVSGRPGIRDPDARSPAGDGLGARSPRLWSARRIPAAVVALVALCAFGVTLYDVIAVRAGQRAGAWRTGLADELASRPVDDLWMLIGAAVAVVLGLWLLFLALTPACADCCRCGHPTAVRDCVPGWTVGEPNWCCAIPRCGSPA